MVKLTETDRQVLAFLKRQFPKMKINIVSIKAKKMMIKAYYDTEAELRKQGRGWN